MKTLSIFFVILLFSSQTLANPDYVKQAYKNAKSWMQMLDQGNADASWQALSPLFSSQLSKGDWQASVKGLRMTFGPTGTRTLLSSQYKTSSYGAPDGDYVDVQFTTDYGNAPSRKETVTLVREASGDWKVAGFAIE